MVVCQGVCSAHLEVPAENRRARVLVLVEDAWRVHSKESFGSEGAVRPHSIVGDDNSGHTLPRSWRQWWLVSDFQSHSLWSVESSAPPWPGGVSTTEQDEKQNAQHGKDALQFVKVGHR